MENLFADRQETEHECFKNLLTQLPLHTRQPKQVFNKFETYKEDPDPLKSTESEEFEERKFVPLKQQGLGKIVVRNNRWASEDHMKKCIIKGYSIEDQNLVNWEDDCMNLEGTNACATFKFGKTSKYLGKNPLAKVTLEIVCYAA